MTPTALLTEPERVSEGARTSERVEHEPAGGAAVGATVGAAVGGFVNRGAGVAVLPEPQTFTTNIASVHRRLNPHCTLKVKLSTALPFGAVYSKAPLRASRVRVPDLGDTFRTKLRMDGYGQGKLPSDFREPDSVWEGAADCVIVQKDCP